MNRQEDWAGMVRKYIVSRDAKFIDKATRLLQDERIIDLLNALQSAHTDEDLNLISTNSSSIAEGLFLSQQFEAAYTIRLLYADVYASFVKFSSQVEPDQKDWFLQQGMKSCQSGVIYSTFVNDYACIVHFLTIKADGLHQLLELEHARETYLSRRSQFTRRFYISKNYDWITSGHLVALKYCTQIDPDETYIHLLLSSIIKNNLANVLFDLRDLEGSILYLEESIAEHKKLFDYDSHRDVDGLIGSMINISNAMRDMNMISSAQVLLEEALEICSQSVVESFVESYVLNTLGTIYAVQMEWRLAQPFFERALAIQLRFSGSAAHQYSGDISITYNNLGLCLSNLKQFEAALEMCNKALEIRLQYKLWLWAAESYASLGTIEYKLYQYKNARLLYEKTVECCERDILQLEEQQHRDVFKGKIEYAYTWLIESYAQGFIDGSQKQIERLVGLIESLRRVESIAGFDDVPAIGLESWKTAYHEFLKGSSPLAKRFQLEQCALLWVQATPKYLIFITFVPGTYSVDITDRTLLDTFAAMFSEAETAMKEYLRRVYLLQSQLLPGESPSINEIEDIRADVAHNLPIRGESVFKSLPANIQMLLKDEKIQSIFLAPCRATIFLPFEMLRVPAGSSSGSDYEDAYLGTRKLMPRVHGFGEMIQVVTRCPNLRLFPYVLIVNNPLHNGASSLSGTAEAQKDTLKPLA